MRSVRVPAVVLLSLVLCASLSLLATADPTPDSPGEVPVVPVGAEPSESYLQYSAAAMECNAAGDRVIAALPAQNRGGYECTDPLDQTLMVYLAGGENAARQWTPAAQAAAATTGHTITVVPVSLPLTDLEPWIDTATWPEAARNLVVPDLVRVGANFKTSSLELGVKPGTRTWTAEQISELLGVPVTVIEEDGIPELTPG